MHIFGWFLNKYIRNVLRLYNMVHIWDFSLLLDFFLFFIENFHSGRVFTGIAKCIIRELIFRQEICPSYSCKISIWPHMWVFSSSLPYLLILSHSLGIKSHSKHTSLNTGLQVWPFRYFRWFFFKSEEFLQFTALKSENGQSPYYRGSWCGTASHEYNHWNYNFTIW